MPGNRPIFQANYTIIRCPQDRLLVNGAVLNRFAVLYYSADWCVAHQLATPPGFKSGKKEARFLFSWLSGFLTTALGLGSSMPKTTKSTMPIPANKIHFLSERGLTALAVFGFPRP